MDAGEASSTTGPRLISIYTGAGGLDLGFEAAGFTTLASIEVDPDARSTIELNRPSWGLLEQGDALLVNAADVLAKAGMERGEVDALVGGPPCQPFSKSAFWVAGSTKRLDDPRADTLGAMLNLAEAILPRAIVIENVPGIAYRKKDEAKKLIEQRLEAINQRNGTSYTAAICCLQATDFGVPQVRERAFVVAFRDGSTFVPPQPYTADALDKPTAWDAIGGLTAGGDTEVTLKPKGKWADLLPSIPEGGNYLWHTDRGGGLPLFGWRTRYWSFLLKLAKDRPAWTIQANPGPATGPFHWDGRLLSVEEMARLQSFPAGYVVVGDYRSARRQIGNAVPPALAEAVARRIASTLSGTHYDPKLTLAVARQGKAPAATPHTLPPDRYSKLVGTYAAHPGHGKGPGALRRVVPVSTVADNRGKNSHADATDLSCEERSAA